MQRFLAVCTITPHDKPDETRYRHYFCRRENEAIRVCKTSAKPDGEVKAVWVFRIFEKLLTPKLLLGNEDEVKKDEKLALSYAKSAQAAYFKDGVPETKEDKKRHQKPKVKTKALVVVKSAEEVIKEETYKPGYNLKEAKIPQ